MFAACPFTADWFVPLDTGVLVASFVFVMTKLNSEASMSRPFSVFVA